MLRRALIALALAILTTIAIAWAASLQSRVGSNVRFGMTFRHREPSKGEGEGWLRAHRQFKPGWRCSFAQAVPLLGYESVTPTSRTPEQDIRGHAFPLALPWLTGERPWPAADKSEMVNLDEYGWPFLALYTRTFGMLATDPTEHILRIDAIHWFNRRPLGDLPGLPIGIVWPGFLADTLLWMVPWALLCFAAPIRRALRVRRGHCPACNYDLRATPAGSPCPECGALAPSV